MTPAWRLYRRIVTAALAVLPGLALAHKPSDSYLSLALDAHADVAVEWHVALRDLDTELRLDEDDDGRLTWGEVKPRWSALREFVGPHLSVKATSAGGLDATPCRLDTPEPALAAPQLEAHTDGNYAVLRWALRCEGRPAAAGPLELRYTLFASTDPTHRGLVRWQGEGAAQDAVVLGTTRQTHRIDLSPPTGATGRSGSLATFTRFVADGVHHLAIGTDHVLFLCALLLVSVWQRPRQAHRGLPLAGWVPRARARDAWLEALRLVTAFTVAHSLTLGLAIFGVVAPPSRWVESFIAASVLLAALDNLWPLVRAPRWPVVFAFGAVHGFGFAGALQDVGLDEGHLLLPLLGFNLGVELGQLAGVTIAMPLLLALRHTRVYRGAVTVGSLAIATLALIWLVERAFDITL